MTNRYGRRDWVVVKLTANRRRTGRTRKKEQHQSELPDGGLEQKAVEQEVKGSVEPEGDKAKEEKTEAELKSFEAEIVATSQHEQHQPLSVEHAQSESVGPSKQEEVKPQTGQKLGGKRVAENREGIFEGLTKINESFFSLEGVKKAAAWYIETSEKLANQALELQEKATGWAKDTPFAALFEAQTSFARKFVERSAHAARTLWQIHPIQ
jgi:hypothetical protein